MTLPKDITDYQFLFLIISFYSFYWSRFKPTKWKISKTWEHFDKKRKYLAHKFIHLDEIDLNKTIDEFRVQWLFINTTNDNAIKKETLLWQQKWICSNELPNMFIEALNMCNKSIFPNIYTTERSFSPLKCLKSYLRNTTSKKSIF